MNSAIKKADLKAPRFRRTRTMLLGMKGFLDEFIKEHPKYKDLKSQDFRKYIGAFHNEIWRTVLATRDGVELPENLGYLFLGTCKPPKKRGTDHKASQVYNALIKHRNFESDNHLAKIFYTNYASKYKLSQRQLWKFEAHRDFKRAVPEYYRQNWKIYLQVENYKMINKQFKKVLVREKLEKLTELSLENYNEFDLD